MKAIRIFLLILIVIGLGLIFTESLWVPSLVNKILKYQNNAAQSAAPSSATPIVTINKSSLTTTSVTPTITGTAVGIPYVEVLLAIGKYDTVYTSDAVPVINNQWSITATPPQGGTYQISVFGLRGTKATPGNVTDVLATSTLVINASQPTATIDQSSLTQVVPQYGSPIITGTVSNINKITLYVSGYHNLVHPDDTAATLYMDPPINGHWSITFPNSNIEWSPGTYPIQVRDTNGDVLASGTLIVSLPSASEIHSDPLPAQQ